MKIRSIHVVTFLVAWYSVFLLLIELTTSQAYVRHYVTDLLGPVVFYGINTTLTMSLLWGTALLCAVAIYLRQEPRPWSSRAGRFLCSQVALFAYLGFDDRFSVHERIGMRVPFDDAWVLLALGVAQVVTLLWYRAEWDSTAARRWLITAGGFFLVMSAIDGMAPSKLTLRLSVEDLTKTWSAFFLFLFGWEMVRQQHNRVEAPTRAAPPADSSASDHAG